MLKRKTLCAATLVLIFMFAAAAPSTAHAGWFGEKLTASIFSAVSSFFQRVGSVITETVSKILPSKSSPEQPFEASCIPPVSPKPSTEQHALGTMTITPEISEETKDNTITVSLISRIDSLSVEFATDPLSPYRWSTLADNNVVDWGPKPAELPRGGKGVNIKMGAGLIKWETYEYSDENGRMQKQPWLPAQKYWVKLRAERTIPLGSNENIGSYGWKEIKYHIHYVEGAGLRTEDFKTVSGNSFYYVGGAQFPVGKIVRVGQNPDPHYDKFVTVKAGEPFEIEAKPTGWQGATMTIDTGSATTGPNKAPTGNIIGPSNITVKAGESAIFKVLPRGTYPVEGRIDIKNNCSDTFKDRYFNTQIGTFRAPIKFDFKGVVKETMRLTFQGGSFVLDFQKPQSSLTVIPWLTLMDGGIVVAPAPDQTIVLQAVYKDNPKEVVKNVIITPTQAITDKEGTVRIKVSAPNITKEELSRGILLKVSTPDIADLTSEAELLFTGVAIEVTKPQTPLPPTPQPQPTPTPEPSKQLPVQSLLVSANKTITELTEGDKVTFTAKLMLSDGSLQTTKNIKWAVLGQIGSITSDGVFTAKLDELIAEAGEALGFVTATYEDSAGNAFLGQTSLIKVKAFVPDQTETQG